MERIDNVERGQVLCTPNLFSLKGERAARRMTRKRTTDADCAISCGLARVICGHGGLRRNIPEELKSQRLSGAYSRERTLPV